ncbi:tetratricopeptide repeat protein [Marinobacter salicampi]|uniref:tetratricopeptide repeat protein n=1 Tax=Marinobacter salicampi TaxID=435907 RepID=UPI00140B7F04|nr:tetratricopeptide repeat protein [Marinobacter salicampi]
MRRERDRRCAIVSERFNGRALTSETLASYRAGYAFSCPKEVDRFGQRLADQQSPAMEKAATEPPTVVSSRLSKALNDCYLLTRIRNFSDALQACRGPAEDGDQRAQVNMALISHSLEDYSQAQKWARESAPDSPEAAFLLGRMYLGGQGVERDNESAQRWFAQAAQQGHPEAKAMLQRAEGRDPEMSITNR